MLEDFPWPGNVREPRKVIKCREKGAGSIERRSGMGREQFVEHLGQRVGLVVDDVRDFHLPIALLSSSSEVFRASANVAFMVAGMRYSRLVRKVALYSALRFITLLRSIFAGMIPLTRHFSGKALMAFLTSVLVFERW